MMGGELKKLRRKVRFWLVKNLAISFLRFTLSTLYAVAGSVAEGFLLGVKGVWGYVATLLYAAYVLIAVGVITLFSFMFLNLYYEYSKNKVAKRIIDFVDSLGKVHFNLNVTKEEALLVLLFIGLLILISPTVYLLVKREAESLGALKRDLNFIFSEYRKAKEQLEVRESRMERKETGKRKKRNDDWRKRVDPEILENAEKVWKKTHEELMEIWRNAPKDPDRPTLTHRDYIETHYVQPLKRELEKIVGQELAKRLVLSIIPKQAEKRLLSGQKFKPVSFLLVGKTGVGKTELVKRTAEALKGVGYKFFRIDANQLRTPESVQSLFGSPRGYIGSDSVPLFIQEVKDSKGKMVILIDEIEKAHPDFLKPFMTLLDEGEVTFTTTGERLKLTDSYIFITSNLEADRISREVSKVESETEKLLKAKELLEASFLPEILGRINYIVPFEDLKPEQYAEIIKRKLEEVGLRSDWETAVKLYNYFVEKGVLKRGVREVIKTIETYSLFPEEFERIVR